MTNPYEPPIRAELADQPRPPRRWGLIGQFLESCWQLFIIILVIMTILGVPLWLIGNIAS